MRVVAATTVEEGIDPVGALADGAGSPVLPEPGRHRQPEVRAVGVGEAVPQCGADVVCFEIQLVRAMRAWMPRPAVAQIELR